MTHYFEVRRFAAFPMFLLAMMVPLTPGWATASVYLRADFESGQVQEASSDVDGFFIATVRDPQVGDEFIGTGSGGFGPETNWDTKVVQSEYVGSEYVAPRAGSYFLRSSIDYQKDYLALNRYSRDKPRSIILLTNTSQRFDFDEEAWLGFSLYLPKNFEHENGVTDHRGTIQLLSVNAHPDATFFTLGAWVPSYDTTAHWFLQLQTDSQSAIEGSTTRFESIDLGPVTNDLGKWTDFVIRARANPFSSRTNPAQSGIPDSREKWYEGNRGIMQLWKATGTPNSDGNREMMLMVNRYQEPVGLVPREGEEHRVSFRIYKYGWKSNETTVKGPVWVGFDEIRYGVTDRHDTGFNDVAPAAASVANPLPKPPSLQ